MIRIIPRQNLRSYGIRAPVRSAIGVQGQLGSSRLTGSQRCYGDNRLPDLNLSQQIGDDQVSELASKSLHKFSLADLVRYVSLFPPISIPSPTPQPSILTLHQTWQPAPLSTSTIRLSKLHIVSPAYSTSTPNPRIKKLAIYCGSESLNFAYIRELSAFPVDAPSLLPPINKQ